MSFIQASCPQCNASYQLTPEQLSVAAGKVRCGACGTVFQAGPAPEIFTPPAQVAPKPVIKIAAEQPKSQFVDEKDDELLFSDNDGISDQSSALKSPAKSAFVIDEDAIADSEEDKQETKKDTLLDLDQFDLTNFDDDEGGFGRNNAVNKLAEDEEDWAKALLEDEGIDAGVIHKEETQPKKEQPRQALGSSADDFDFDLEGLDGAPLTLSSEEEANYGFGEEATKEEMIRNIKSEPLVFQVFNSRSLASTLGLSILGSIAIFGLILQLFIFQKDTLSRDPKWHSLYQTVCSITGCSLPDQYSINDIQATNLTVKSHPHYLNALMIDAIIVNHADIMQPFPHIKLFFTDNNQTVIAAREFLPTEYLRGELADASLMPNQQSIHIALEINDPGNTATGYRLELAY